MGVAAAIGSWRFRKLATSANACVASWGTTRRDVTTIATTCFQSPSPSVALSHASTKSTTPENDTHTHLILDRFSLCTS